MRMVISRRILIGAAFLGLASAVWLFGLPSSSTASGPNSSGKQHPSLVVLTDGLSNGGILGVVMGVLEASQHHNWSVEVFDVGSSQFGSAQLLDDVLALELDGLILVGIDINTSPHQQFLDDAEALGIPVMGWHVHPYPGAVADSPLRVNVTSDSLAVARAAAALVQPVAGQTAGLVVFTDSRFSIAMEKADRMLEALQHCERCTVLAVEDIPLDRTAELMPLAVRRLQARFGERWTHSLAINDLYFDHAVRELVNSKLSPPLSISAGDGSPSALLRIRHRSFQYASVAEPLLLHGWQLVDELDLAMAGEPPSGYVNPPYTLTHDNVAELVNERGFFEPLGSYREDYQQQWQVRRDR